MPLETIDKDPFWSKRMRMSAENMRRQKEEALAVGRDAWNAATRLGQDVKAQTESELAELGRKTLEAKARAQRSADAVTLSTLGTSTNPTAVRVVGEWATGLGPARRELGPDATMAKQFAEAGNTRAHLRNAVYHWKARPGGLDANGGSYTSYRAIFGPKEIDQAGANPTAQAIGSAKFDGRRVGDRLEWRATNDMGLHSLFEGRVLDATGLPTVGNVRRPGPLGTTRQVLHFRTDLHGNPIF